MYNQHSNSIFFRKSFTITSERGTAECVTKYHWPENQIFRKKTHCKNTNSWNGILWTAVYFALAKHRDFALFSSFVTVQTELTFKCYFRSTFGFGGKSSPFAAVSGMTQGSRIVTFFSSTSWFWTSVVMHSSARQYCPLPNFPKGENIPHVHKLEEVKGRSCVRVLCASSHTRAVTERDRPFRQFFLSQLPTFSVQKMKIINLSSFKNAVLRMILRESNRF